MFSRNTNNIWLEILTLRISGRKCNIDDIRIGAYQKYLGLTSLEYLSHHDINQFLVEASDKSLELVIFSTLK